MEDDLGWQQTPLMRKFHYFVGTKSGGMQTALCQKWGMFRGEAREPDLGKPNNESCRGCAKLWEKEYG